MNLINKILAVLILISGVLGLLFIFVPVSQNINDIDAGVFILSLCAFGLIETIKIKKYLFTTLIGLMTIIFIIGIFSSL
ncbi:hypothetical protein EB001_06315 [bacterium]|nr:hypothetical protein [bacterium]